MPLAEYRRKRKFADTPEPRGGAGASGAPIFVVQRHAARRLHFDFRMQIGGVLASWAVPKGPPLVAGEKRLAVHVEDHPLEYAKFEGQIPAGHYGAGDVQIWDRGTFQTEEPPDAAAQLARGDFKFHLAGQRLRGRFVLVKLKKSEKGNEWLLIRKTDTDAEGAAPRESIPRSDRRSGASKAARASLGSESQSEIVDPASLEGAMEAPMPAEVSAALATLVAEPFSDPQWFYEIKWDGERALAYVRDGAIELRARSGRNITAEYPELKNLPKLLHARQAILDGEIVVLDDSGRSDFQRIQNRFGVANPSVRLMEEHPATYYLFDVVYCDGYDLRRVALRVRKRFLKEILKTTPAVRFSDHQAEKGVELFELARQERLEGIVAKEQNSPYIGKRTSNWLKFKVVQDLDAVVGGWTEPRKTGDFFGALLLGLYRGADLQYIGSVGTGFSQEGLRQIHDALQRLRTPACPFKNRPKTKETSHWVKPELVARVKFASWTEDERLRAPVFLGFREDVAARDCVFEKPVEGAEHEHPNPGAADPAPTRAPVHARRSSWQPGDSHVEDALANGNENALSVQVDGHTLSLTNLNKVYFPESGIKKRDLLLYYFRIAGRILPFLKDRPLVLKRYPNGIDRQFFFQKEAPAPRPDWLKTVPIYSDERESEMPYLVANDRAMLLYLVNLGCIDHNPWSSRFGDEEHPDYVFFDLDPTEGTPFATVQKVAGIVHKRLEQMGVRPYMKTSGASGFHLFVPLVRNYTYAEVRLFVDAVGQRVKEQLPGVITSERAVRRRKKGTVLLDSLQNAHGKPLASVYSVRPFPGAPVSTPIGAAELSKEIRPESFNVKTIFQRLENAGDLWADFWEHRHRLEDVVAKS